jgi:hypothetical protein
VAGEQDWQLGRRCIPERTYRRLRDSAPICTALALFIGVGCNHRQGREDISTRQRALDEGTAAWTNLYAAPGSPGEMLAFDSDRGKAVLFGGSRELWEWDSRTTIWKNRTPSPLPTTWPTTVGTLTYDKASKRVFKAGGRGMRAFVIVLTET